MKKTVVEIILEGKLFRETGYIDKYFWNEGDPYCIVVLKNSIELLDIGSLKPINLSEARHND